MAIIGLFSPLLSSAAEPGETGAFPVLYGIIFSISYVILNYAVIVLAFLAQTLNVIIHFPIDTNLPVLEVAWKLIRNFSNMFFIVIMIIMAFGTIFNVGNYYWRSLIGRFIIAALLINFSLVIGQQIVILTQSVNSVFLTAIGDLANQIGQILKPAALLGTSEGFVSEETAQKASQTAKWLGGIMGYFPGGPLGSAIGGTLAEAVTYTGLKIDTLTFFVTMRVLAGVVLTMMVIFSLLIGVIFSLIRIPIIWLLLVVSPVAWLANVLPNTKDLNKKWWDYFLAWNLFLPIYLFVVYFGIFFLREYESIISSLSKYTGMSVITNPLSVGFSIQYLLAYILVALIFIFGTGLAISGGFWSSSGVLKAAGWAREAAWRIPGFRTGRAIGQAAALKGKEIERKGLPGLGRYVYGGEAAEKRRAAQWAERFGVSGVLAKQIADERKRMKDENWSEADLKRELSSRGAGAFAAADQLLDDDKLSAGEAANILKQYKDMAPFGERAFRDKMRKKLQERREKATFRDDEEAYKFIEAFADRTRNEHETWVNDIAKKDASMAADIMLRQGRAASRDAAFKDIVQGLDEEELVKQKDKMFVPPIAVELESVLKDLKIAGTINPQQITNILNQSMSARKRTLFTNALT